jgi:NAD(P)H-quinone oxidoreductase subunit 5
MAILSLVLCGTVGSFGLSYLHRDAGFQRFFLSFAMFLVGMTFASLAGTIETLFLGWELVGLSSALLVAYFHERQSPVSNGLRVWAIYRLADAAFLAAAIALHHQTGEGDFGVLMGNEAWPAGTASLSNGSALLVGTFLLIAAAGKSGLVPFSGWLPRAMEGPTPSSAIFYGALSVHLGAFLLLRVSPILDQSWLLSWMVIGLGLVSAAFAALAGRVQTDIKSALAFASLTQVSIIVVEIGVGFRYLALIHIVGHACMRSLQLLRAPTLLRDYKTMENAIGKALDHGSPRIIAGLGASTQRRLYRGAMERGYMDAMLDECIVNPFVRLFSTFNRWERTWTHWLAGSHHHSKSLPHDTRND